MSYIKGFTKEELAEEVLHFQEIASLVLPRTKDFPRFPNVDYHIAIEPLIGCVGGDHIAIVNFDEYHIKEKLAEAKKNGEISLATKLAQNLNAFGILVADVAGHMISDNLTVNYLHAAFKTGIAYELKYNGHVTAGLFEMLNTSFYNRMTPDYIQRLPYLTLLYGEMHNDGRFKYLSAGHHTPIIFSKRNNKIEELDDSCSYTSSPIGIFPSEHDIDNERSEPILRRKKDYCINEVALLGEGDVMLLYTDGLLERCNTPEKESKFLLEQIIKDVQDGTAEEISTTLRSELKNICPPDDDMSLVVIKKV